MTELVLHEACAIGDAEALEEYLKTGKYDPNCTDEEWGGKAPLHWACIRGKSSQMDFGTFQCKNFVHNKYWRRELNIIYKLLF